MSVISKRGDPKLKKIVFQKILKYANAERPEQRALMPHRPVSTVSSWPVLSALPPLTLSDPSVSRCICLLCAPSHLPKDAGPGSGSFKTLPGWATEHAGHGSGVGGTWPSPWRRSPAARRLAFLPLSSVWLECLLPGNCGRFTAEALSH